MSVLARIEHQEKALSSRPKRLMIVLAIVLTLVVLVGAAIGVSRWNTKRRRDDLAAKKHALVAQATAQLAPQNVKKLAPLVAQIKQQPNYSSDQSYLYILLAYDINISDPHAANSDFQQLKKVYKNDAAYDPSLAPHVISQSALTDTVEFLQHQAADSGVMTFGGSLSQ